MGIQPFFLDETDLKELGDVFDITLRALAERGLVDKYAGHLVVLDLTRGFHRDDTAWRNYPLQRVVTEFSLFDDMVGPNVLFERSFGPPDSTFKYRQIGRVKALLAGRARKDTGEIIHHDPLVLLPGDIQFDGGIYRNGICLGFSGVQREMDHSLACVYYELMQGRACLKSRALAADPERLAFL